MTRITACLVLFALMAASAFGSVIVSVEKEPLPINGLDVYDVHITGYAGADDFPGNTISGLEGTFTAIGGTIQFNGGTVTQQKHNASNVLAGQGVSSWINFNSYVGSFVRTGPPAASALSATWFTVDQNDRLRPVDETVGTNDDGLDQTLLAQIFVSPGGDFQFIGKTNGGNSASLGQPLQFGTISFPGADPIAVTVSPFSGTNLAPGALISVSNAAASAQISRDPATVSKATFSSSRGEFRLRS